LSDLALNAYGSPHPIQSLFDFGLGRNHPKGIEVPGVVTSFVSTYTSLFLRHGRRPAHQRPLPNFSLAMIDDPTVIHHQLRLPSNWNISSPHNTRQICHGAQQPPPTQHDTQREVPHLWSPGYDQNCRRRRPSPHIIQFLLSRREPGAMFLRQQRPSMTWTIQWRLPKVRYLSSFSFKSEVELKR